jgi:hypothetical protein
MYDPNSQNGGIWIYIGAAATVGLIIAVGGLFSS